MPEAPRSSVRWLLGALPAITFLATFGVFFLHKNREARTVLESGRGILTVAAIFGGYILIAVLLRRFARWAWVPPLALTALILGLAAWIVRPYYVDETADRQLVSGPVQEAPASGGIGSQAPPRTSPQAPEAPTRLSSGGLTGIGHSASGRASIIRSPDGSSLVRFESFAIEGTPDPVVYLIQASNARRPGGVELGRLQGNRGQVLDYRVPQGTPAGPGWTVLVWCRRFAVPIANATQTAA